ncbi:MAG TPA: tyrosine--tRNA ligase [Oscillospiraceae bacterium]|nr:tyrosine--tRNA ligase [Oscillospiraceae bacterium]HPK34210.1 tyrosine--tRNA ligase [Oscillospiraceae bacterium]HPR74887.1 tyrosine--tRNA ligase [Oscillospiraceae bacterium]
MMTLFEELKARELVAQTTDEQLIAEKLEKENVTFYVGFDPTADSLHIGHLLAIVSMARLQRAGHKPIALIGGGTAMVGDPSGRSDMRQMLTKEQIEYNGNCFVSQMSAILDFTSDKPNKAILVNNADWLLKLNYIDFLREIGSHFSVNRMLTFECYKSRMEKGLSFIEFNYMPMQSYDFLMLFRKYGCTMEFGGDDQWSNILGGTELIRRIEGADANAMTFNLLLTAEGKKMGKTAKGAVWLDPKKTSPYDFYQYWRNIDDADVIKTMKMLTFIPLEQIAEYEKATGSELNAVKETLAYEITQMIHGKEAADGCLTAAKALFGGGGDLENMPSTEITKDEFEADGIEVLKLLTLSKLAPSRGEGRRLIEQGGISVDDEKVKSFGEKVSINAFDKGSVIIKKGKKVFHRIILK